MTNAVNLSSLGSGGTVSVNSSGALLVNTATQTGSTRLVVADTTGAGQIRAIHSTGLGLLISQNAASGAANINLQDSATLSFATNNSDRMYIDSSGNVGIGTSSPATRLDVYTTTASTTTGVLKLYGANGADRYTGIDFHGVTSETYNKIAQITALVTNGGNGGGNPIGGDLIFRTNNSSSNIPTEKMRIDSSGNVGIGTTTPVAKQHIKGSGTSGQTTASLIVENASSGTLGLDITGTAGSSYARLRYGGGPSTGTNAMTGDAALIGLEGSSVGFQQIRFAATQVASSDANTLDDYEEGTWTPNIIHQSSNNSTWTVKYGYYTKVGRLVTAWFVCDAGNSGTSGSPLQLTGLPFTIGGSPGAVTWGIWGTNGTVRNGGLVVNGLGASAMFLYTGGGQLTEQQSYASGCTSYFV